ncbi:MAG: leucine-rich repeat protein [Clostridia bacterium]|nr:leucine-rich repeat protein [Clostridia bacterium]
MKKIISVFLSTALLISIFSFLIVNPNITASAALNFKCGDNAVWYLDTQTGIFTISGEGETYDYSGSFGQPWSEFNRNVTVVVIEEGITALGDYILYGFSNCSSVSLSSTLEYIGNHVFSNNVAEITVSENSSLKYFNDYFSIKKTKWFKNQPEGLVYLDNVCVGYQGEITADDIITLKEETVSIAPEAFYGYTDLTTFYCPETVEFIGDRALDNTAFLSGQPVGALYIGKVLYKYVGNVSLEDYEFTVKEGTTNITSNAFYGKSIIKSIFFPKSLRTIGNYAFFNSSLTDIAFENGSNLKAIGKSAFNCCRIGNPQLPEGLEIIDDLAFGPYGVELLKIPASVRRIGKLYCTGSSNVDLRASYEVEEENVYYSSDESHNLYDKNKTVLVRASTGQTNSAVPETVIKLAPGAFRYISAIKCIVLPDDLQTIGEEAFAWWAYDNAGVEKIIDFGYSEPTIGSNIFANDRYLSSVIVRSMNLTFPEGAFSDVINENFTVYLMRGSAMQTYCDAYGINYEFLDYTLQLEEINNLLLTVETIDRALYTEESLAKLDETVSQVNLNLKNITQEQVDEWAYTVSNALSLLVYLPADYTALNEALASARAVNRSLYTADSLLALDTLVLSVDYNANITQQAVIDKTAFDITEAVGALQYRSADYSLVNASISRAISVDRSLYTENSIDNLDTALQSVVYGLDITQQNKVNAFANSIELAIDALVPKAADYTDVETAVARANAINRAFYTAESLNILDDAVSAVDYSLNYDNQQMVADYAAAINSAVDKLIYLPADYTLVDNAAEQANAIDRIMWSESSLTALDQSVSDVNRNLNITQQAIVDAYAANILSKLNSLKHKNVVLRNESNGVIVSATSEEIYPLTSLSVDKLDPSDIENANFAVGGKVKTALYFDISLYKNSIKTQPNGTVTVKIRIPSGVEPDKCKVYHVTDDPVDPLVKFTSTLDGNYIVFTTDHFSEFAVLEIETVLEGIVISSPPAKTVYVKGEAFSRDGMTITAFFSDGRSSVVDDYDVSVDTDSVGSRPYNIYYTFNGITKTVSSVVIVTESPASYIQTDKIVLKVPTSQTVEYRCKVKITVEAKGIPEGYSIVLYSGNNDIARSQTGIITCYLGEMTESQNFYVKVIGKDGKTAVDSNKRPVQSDFRIEVKAGFFDRIIATFKALFRLLPEISI